MIDRARHPALDVRLAGTGVHHYLAWAVAAASRFHGSRAGGGPPAATKARRG